MTRAEELRHEQVTAGVLHRMQRRGLSKCLLAWQAWTVQKLAVRNMLQKTVLRIQNMYVASAFGSWQAWSNRQQHVRAIEMKCLKRLKIIAVSKAWSVWWSLRCKMVRVRQMLVKLKYRSVSLAFTTWIGVLEDTRKAAERAAFRAEMSRAEELRHTQLMMSASQRLQNRGLMKCLLAWQSFAVQKVAVRNMVRKVVRRLQNMVVTTAIYVWLAWSSRQRHVRSIETKCVQRVKSMLVSKVWSAWWSLRCKLVRVRQMLAKLKNRSVSFAFATWVGVVFAARTAGLVAAKEADRGLFQAEMTRAEDLRHKQLMTLAGQRIQRRALSKCVLAWQAYTVGKAHLRNVAFKVTQRISNLYLASAFSSWHANVADLIATRGRLQKAFRRLQNRRGAAALKSWAELVDETRYAALMQTQADERAASLAFLRKNEAEADELRHGQIVAGAVRRILQRGLSQCLVTWQAWSARRRHVRVVSRKALTRLQNAAIAHAWSGWWSHCYKMVSERQMLRKLKYLTVLGAFDSWVATVAETRNLGEHVSLHADLQSALELRHKQVMTGASIRWNYRAVSKSFTAWQTYSLYRMELEKLAKKVLQRVLNIRVAAAFAAIVYWGGRRKQLRLMGSKSIGRWKLFAVAAVMTAWSSYAAVKNQGRAESRIVATMRLGRWRQKTLFLCFGRWHKWVVHSQNVRVKLTSMKARVDRMRLARAIAGWGGHRHYNLLLASRFAEFVGRCNTRLLVWTVLSWSREAKSLVIKTKRREVAGKVAELRMARAEREREVASLIEKFNVKANTLLEDANKSNYEMIKTRAQAKMFREEATSHYREQQNEMATRTQSQQAAVSKLLDEAVSVAERNAEAAGQALVARLDATAATVTAPETVRPAPEKNISGGQAQHVRQLLRQIGGEEDSAGNISGGGPERTISANQVQNVRAMLETALSPEGVSKDIRDVLADSLRGVRGAASVVSSSEDIEVFSVSSEDGPRPKRPKVERRISVWIHAMAGRRKNRALNACFDAWVSWLVERLQGGSATVVANPRAAGDASLQAWLE